MKLSEITVTDREPLLIELMRMLLARGDKIWFNGRYAVLPVIAITKAVVDQPRTAFNAEYHGAAFNIKLDGGGWGGFVITPPDADQWELVPHEQSDDETRQWMLQRAKR